MIDSTDDTAYGIAMTVRRAVLDSNVLVSGLRSKRGASFKLLGLVGGGEFMTVVSVPLVIEYEKALLDSHHGLPYTPVEIGRFLDYFCGVSDCRKVHFLWRPCLPDVTDDMVLEAAVAGRCRYIVTFNVRDFVGAAQFGIRALPPAEFLKVPGEKR
jgi:putative PIN family toxin of toxin-antitoxin system